METEQAQEWAATLKALAHPTRLQIVTELLAGTRCVTDMEEILPASQANISQHLAVLRHANLVDFAQDGSLRCYYLSRPQLVEGLFALLCANLPVMRKTREQIQREKALAGHQEVSHEGS
jgi:ArsR family transcriptional regulator